jgi:1-pyrroline-5-carboxylate dehydrogenase
LRTAIASAGVAAVWSSKRRNRSEPGEPSARIFQEEIVGLVPAVTKARDFGGAPAKANDSEYGLAGAVSSNNPEHLRAGRGRFHAGNLYFNR